MTENTEVTTDQLGEITMAEENSNNVNISVEQICAAILATIGSATVAVPDLVKDYTKHQIQVTQNEDGTIQFTLVEEPQETPAEEQAE